MNRGMLRETLGAAVAGAVLWWFAGGLHPLWPFAWLAPVPALWVALRQGRRAGFIAAFAGLAAGNLRTASFLYSALHVPAAVVAAAVLVPALTLGACVLLARSWQRRLGSVAGAFAFAISGAAFEAINTLASPNGTYGSLAYTQADFLPVLQLAAYGGTEAITFTVLLSAAALAMVLHGATAAAAWRPAAALLLVTWSTVGAVGAARLAEPPAGTSVRVALAAADDTVLRGLSGEADAVADIVARFERMADAAHARGARVMVLPEEVVGVRAPALAAVAARMAQTAQRNGVLLVAGVRELDEPLGRNVALVSRADGQSLQPYVKHHLVPGLETAHLAPGSGILTQGGAGDGLPGTWGVQICKDLDFPGLSARYGAAGTSLLLVPAWDFGEDGWLHSRMAVVRGVEQGFGIARSAAEGRLTLSDSRGRVLEELASSSAPDALLVADLPVGPAEVTPYARGGDAFGPACLAVAMGLVVFAIARPRRKSG